jgi:uncharacterized membrane protein YdfJ with MMPL/SSD domain
VILGILALGLTGLKDSGLTNAQSFRGARPDSVIGASVLAAHFPAGAGQPVIVIGNAHAATPLRAAFAATPGISHVTPPATRAGYAYLQGTLTSPPDSAAAYATIDRARAQVHAVPGGHALVGGTTAISLDVARASTHDRNREEAHKRDARHGAITGLAATGGVITSAGFVLAGTFAVLATLQSTTFTEIGFAVAFGILLDTIIVRSVLVTALNLDVGRWMWWPSKLAHKPDPAPADLSQERASALTTA